MILFQVLGVGVHFGVGYAYFLRADSMRKFIVIAALLIATCVAGTLAASVSGSDGAADIIAQWKLGRMYADGEGVKRDDLRAFEYFRGIADAYADEAPDSPQGRFVARAFVALGNYYLEGIPDTAIKPDADRARELFAYAASYFGDPEAQYRLGRLYLDGNGGLKDPKLAVRWLSLAANKGQHPAQAMLGEMLFNGEYVPRQAARGLMWLALARDGASPGETSIADLYATARKQATVEDRAAARVDLERWLKEHPIKLFFDQ
jgi:uncharacterized protein